MKSKTIKYALYFVFLAVAGALIYHFGARWWAQRQVNQIIFTGLTKDQISSITSEWKKETEESVEWRKNVTGKAFVGAACGNDENISRAFLRAGYSANAQTREGITPLHCAAGNGNLGLAKDFVAAGANVKARTTEDEFLPLHYATASRQWDVVRYFVKIGVSIDEPSKHGTAVMVVANDEIVRRISDNMGKRGKDTQRQNELLATSVGVLAALGAKLDTVAPDGNTLMHYAARAQEPVLMDTLATKHGLLANVKNQRGETPLMFAFRERPWAPTNGAGSHTATIEWLVKSGVDINARDQNGWSIALRAVRDTDFLALLSPGLDLNVADNKGDSIWTQRGWNPVVFSRTQATIGVPLMLNGKPGIGPLHVAVKEALLSDVKYFLQRDVNPNQADQDGLTPLHEVVRWTGGPGDHRINRSLIVKALLDAGADVNARTTQGLTPLMLANNQPGEITQILVDRKADVNAMAVENGKPVSVIDYYFRKANTQGIEVLLKAGARKTNPH